MNEVAYECTNRRGYLEQTNEQENLVLHGSRFQVKQKILRYKVSHFVQCSSVFHFDIPQFIANVKYPKKSLPLYPKTP